MKQRKQIKFSKKINTIEIYDTTLRDGAQTRDVSLSVYDKIQLIKTLDDYGVDYIELGWPSTSEKEMEAFKQASKLKLKNAQIVAFGSTRRKGIKPKDDLNLKSILQTKVKIATLFGKTIKEHVTKQLNMSLDENLRSIEDSIAFLKKSRLKVFFDAEHYFDGFRDEPGYAIKCLEAAVRGGADCLVLCDTNGGMLPEDIREITAQTKKILEQKNLPTRLGIHCHNDTGSGVANTTAAIEYLSQVQGTINGLGERCGNADLSQVVPNIILKKKISLNKINLRKNKEVSEIVYVLTNIKPNKHRAYTGDYCFSHKGGIHVDAIIKGASYEHINPEIVGNKRAIVLSDLSGKANIVEIAKIFGIKTNKNDPAVKEMLKAVEELESKGYLINDIPAEQELLINKYFKHKELPFVVNTWKISTMERRGNFSECVITGSVGKKHWDMVAPSFEKGPVGAAYTAIQRLAARRSKKIYQVKLVNYKVMMAENKGAESSVRVFIEFTDGKHNWGCVGVSDNIIEASMEAIQKGFTYYLQK
ncbi:citramalate synthase [Nanoarchaeota archaeon]